jgi:hypothetical protein
LILKSDGADDDAVGEFVWLDAPRLPLFDDKMLFTKPDEFTDVGINPDKPVLISDAMLVPEFKKLERSSITDTVTPLNKSSGI